MAYHSYGRLYAHDAQPEQKEEGLTGLRRQYHTGSNRPGTKSVALTVPAYERLKERANELGVTIKSLLETLILAHVDDITLDESED